MATKPVDDDFEFEVEGEETPPEVEVVDDTPPEDRDRGEMPKEIVEELEADDLEEYSEKVKQRLKQMKRVYHDERREKERFQRENAEAIAMAKRLHEENQRLKSEYTKGEGYLIDSYKQSSALEVEKAKRALIEAHDEGDNSKIADAQEQLSQATYKAAQVAAYKPTLHPEVKEVEIPSQAQTPTPPDEKTRAWQERNTWYGSDTEMTAAALGLHQKLIAERGPQYAGTDEYWAQVDKTMRRRFPENFEEEEAPRGPKPANVVAPASRSRSSKKIVLKQSELSIAKKLGLTPEQYAREKMKVEN